MKLMIRRNNPNTIRLSWLRAARGKTNVDMAEERVMKTRIKPSMKTKKWIRPSVVNMGGIIKQDDRDKATNRYIHRHRNAETFLFFRLWKTNVRVALHSFCIYHYNSSNLPLDSWVTPDCIVFKDVVMLKIGDFSRLGQVSIDTLRHYDTLGLLKPTEV